MKRFFERLAARPRKGTIIVTFFILFFLMVFSYLFAERGDQDSIFWKLSTWNQPEQGKVKVTPVAPQEDTEEAAEEGYIFPSEEEVEAVRKAALEGMEAEEIDAFTAYVKDYHNWIEGCLVKQEGLFSIKPDM